MAGTEAGVLRAGSKGKYHCTGDLLFYFLGFHCFVHLEFAKDLHVWSNPKLSNRRSVV